LTVALLVVFLAWETVQPFFGFFRGRAKERGRHVIRNLALAALNSVVVAAGFAAVWAAAAGWAEEEGFGLLRMIGPDGWVRVILALLLLDAWNYAWHRANHRIPFLWRFHSVHHSDPTMDVTTSGRYHVGEIVISSVLLALVVVLLGIRLWELLLYEVLAAAIAQFHHANVALPPALDRTLRTLIVTPDMHRVHHSRRPEELNSNFSSLLSVWDRLGGTYRVSASPRDITFGLDGERSLTLSGLMRWPLRQTGVKP